MWHDPFMSCRLLHTLQSCILSLHRGQEGERERMQMSVQTIAEKIRVGSLGEKKNAGKREEAMNILQLINSTLTRIEKARLAFSFLSFPFRLQRETFLFTAMPVRHWNERNLIRFPFELKCFSSWVVVLVALSYHLCVLLGYVDIIWFFAYETRSYLCVS